MRVDEFDFELPADRIALHPAEPRDASRMLVVPAAGLFEDWHTRDLADFLKPDDVLVLNDTRVIPAALDGRRHRGELSASISVNLHKRLTDSRWVGFARPAKRLKVGDRVIFQGEESGNVCLLGSLEGMIAGTSAGGEVTIDFDMSGAVLDEAIKSHGAMPLPPYIGRKRALEQRDLTDYQTVYARQDGAVAAPTAGLHFTPKLLEKVGGMGVLIEYLTLHVGAGTFLPVKADDTSEHRMHAEWGAVSAESVARIRDRKARGGRVVAVGTTSLRLLEAASAGTGGLAAFSGDTDIFITPGYQFRTVDVLMTNFHLPRSTLFMLVSAFGGLMTMKRAYSHAIEANYRFYSYGDAMLIARHGGQP